VSRAQKILFGFFPVLLIGTLASACNHTNSSRYSDAPAGQVFLNPNPNFEASTFTKWNGQSSENNRIKYLLERMAASEESFIRNGETHDGKQARMWFLYKMGHWVSGVNTAEEFVSRVAGYSQKTGDPYLVKQADGKIYSLQSLLKNELLAFDAHQEKIKTASAVSLSPTAVASAAVATSTSS